MESTVREHLLSSPASDYVESAERGSIPTGVTRVLAMHWRDNCVPWRLGTPLNALRESGSELTLAGYGELNTLPDVDILVLHCPGTTAALRLMDEARRRGIKTIVDVDDLFVSGAVRGSWVRQELVADPPAAGVSPALLEHVLERFYQCLRQADAVTVSTEPLRQAYASFNTSIDVLPNCYEDANPLWQPTPRRRETVHIGFAGMKTHASNVLLLGGVLEPILQRYPEVRVVEAGGFELLPLIEAPTRQLVHLGSFPFETFPLVMREMDIVLAPLVDQPFTRAKSNIRCMTAGIVGAPVVASPVGEYAAYVEHGGNGFLARSASEWTTSLERLVSDAALRQRMGLANRRSAAAFGISAHRWRWSEVHGRVLGRHRRA